jgi:hypothetical protein
LPSPFSELCYHTHTEVKKRKLVNMRLVSSALLSVLLASSLNSKAGTFSSDFNSGTTAPAGSTLNGNSVIEATGGVDDSGVLKLTKAIGSQNGSFVIGDLDGGNPVWGFDLTAKLRLGGGGGTPADGFSINFDPTAGPNTTSSEEGTPGGISFTFDLYDNGAETPPAPSFDIKVLGNVIATHHMNISDYDTGADFTDLQVRVSPDGLASLSFKGAIIFTNVIIPDFQPLTGSSFVIAGRTGGAVENQFFDNLQITTYTKPEVGFSRQPVSQTIVAGTDAVLHADITNPNNDALTYQWFKGGTAIPAATSADYTVSNASVADSGAKYKLQVTGPNNTVTTGEFTVTVKDIPVPATPKFSFNFDDGQVPAGTSVAGTAVVTTDGGVANSGALHLTDAAQSQAGAFIVDDADTGAPVYGFTATFDVLLGGHEGDVPADGFSFNFASDIPDDPTTGQPTGSEDGVGTGLTVGFDLYDNGNENPPAPSIDVRYKGAVIASVQMPFQDIETGTSYAPVLIHLDTDGTLDVAFKNRILFDNLTIPGFASVSGGRFALVARTGGSDENQWVDNLDITTDLTAGNLRISTQPVSQTIQVGKSVTFTSGVNDPTGVTFQWLRNGTPINGASSATYTIPAVVAGDNAATLQLKATKGALTATSDAATLTVLDLVPPATPTVSYDFNDGQLPAGAHVYGSGTRADGTTPFVSFVDANGGVNDSGVLKLMVAENGLQGAFVIDPLLGGAELSGFTASFDILVGGHVEPNPPADGFSFNFAPDLPANTVGNAEEGVGTGLSIDFDLWDNGSETPPAPSIDVKYKGNIIATTHLTWQEMETGDAYWNTIVRVSPDGKLDLIYGDRVLENGLQLPNYTPTSNGKFGFYSRTGGANENEWIDNLKIAAVKSSGPLRFTTPPVNQVVLVGNTATFSGTVNDPSGVTYQWSKNGTPIAGATSSSFTTAATTTADTGGKYTLTAQGPGGSVSGDATLTVISPITAQNPEITFDFNDGQVPEGTSVFGSATVDTSGGVDDSGVLKITDAVGGVSGSFVIDDVKAGAPVSAFTATFKLRMGEGSTPPADGLSFVFAPDIPNSAWGPEGTGSGLVVEIDTWDNSTATSPDLIGIDVKYGGAEIATTPLPNSFLQTGTDYIDVGIRMNSNGTVDVTYKDQVIYYQLPLPDFAPISGGRFGIGAATGGAFETHWVDNLNIAFPNVVTGPTITIAKGADGKIVLTWAGGGTLESAPKIDGPWSPVTGATSGIALAPTGTQQFFRVVQP